MRKKYYEIDPVTGERIGTFHSTTPAQAAAKAASRLGDDPLPAGVDARSYIEAYLSEPNIFIQDAETGKIFTYSGVNKMIDPSEQTEYQVKFNITKVPYVISRGQLKIHD
jgi:hypothetical protein